MKNNIEFYPHYTTSDQHAKFKMLRVEFGWSGEGKFWALNNRIAQTDGCCLDISKKYNKASIASDLNFSITEFDNFITFLKDDCELIFECSNGIITTDIVQDTYVKVMSERGRARQKHKKTSTEKSKTSTEKNEISENLQEKSKTSTEKTDRVYNTIQNKTIQDSKNPLAQKSKTTTLKLSKKEIQETKFDQFWTIYPKKKSKGTAKKAFMKINPNQQFLSRIISKIEQAKKSKDWMKENGKYIPYPATWLNAEGWEDEYTENPMDGVLSETGQANVRVLQSWMEDNKEVV
jgi:hypothetical protein